VCPAGHHACLLGVTPERVVAAVLELARGARAPDAGCGGANDASFDATDASFDATAASIGATAPSIGAMAASIDATDASFDAAAAGIAYAGGRRP
jgi:hypothetical protein